MDNVEYLDKAYIGGHEQKPAEFNRVEFASKNLLTRIQNTQSFFHCSSNDNPHVSVEDLWLAAIADVIANSPAPRADNDEFLDQLKIAEQQLGLSAQKIKRALCQSQILNTSALLSGAVITMGALSGIITIMVMLGVKTALSLIFITALLALAGLGVFIGIKALKAYKDQKSKICNIDQQTKRFLQKKHRGLNQAEIFILRRVQGLLPNLTLQK